MGPVDWNAYFASRSAAMLAELGELVAWESPSRDAARIRRVVEYLAGELERAGARVDVDDTHPHGPNLVARYGSGSAPVMLLGHTDTVWPAGTIERLPWRVEAGRAYGPGVFDMKAGCVVALEAIRALAAARAATPVTLVLTCDEEIGSASSLDLVLAEARRSRAVLVLEPSLPGGHAKTSRSGVAGYALTIRGRAAHAGVDPERGRSAIVAAAEIVRALDALNDRERGLSVNVGRIEGGTRSNVVAAEARLDVDVRFRAAADGERIDAAIRSLRPSRDGVGVGVEGGIARPPLEPTAEVLALYHAAREAAAASGFELGHGHVGGASDGNYTAAAGVPTLDGLGPRGLGAHADDEQVEVDDLAPRAAMLVRLVAALAR